MNVAHTLFFAATQVVSPPEDTPEDVATSSYFKPAWQVEGFVDVIYGWAHNHPENRIFRGMAPTPRIDELTLNLVGVRLHHEATDEQPWWIEIGLHAGAAADALLAAEPVPGGEDGRFAGPEVWKHVALANAGAVIPGSGTRIGAGWFSSPIGIGGFWTKDNSHATVSWISNTAPFYLLGLRVTQPIWKGLNAEAWIVNGWQTFADVNRYPSFLMGLAWERDALSAGVYGFAGPEQEQVDADQWRFHYDGYVAWTTPRWRVAVSYDAGHEQYDNAVERGTASWMGGAAFARVTPWRSNDVALNLSVRPEAFWDRNGWLYGVDQWLLAWTTTVSLQLWDRLLLRLEHRYDRSGAANGFFYQRDATGDTDEGLSPDQHLVLLNLTGTFTFAWE